LYHWQPVAENLPRFTMASDSIRYVRAEYDHCYIHIQGSFAEYLQKFSPKTRSTLSRKVKKYAQFSGGQTVWREYSRPGEMEEAYELARVVSAKTYQERLLNAGLPTREEFRRNIEELSQNDAIRCWILFHQEKPVAYLWCPVVAGTLLYEHLGYDPEYSECSPGTVLQYLVLQKIFSERRFQFFDFGQGDGPHKRFFATSTIRSADIYHFRPRARHALLVGGHIGINALSRSIVGALDSVGLKSKIKSLFRSGRRFEARLAAPENAEPAAEQG
jgi:CelD/BcsL family acetyltransferase involved in cellulose biosynthesis